MQFSNPTGGYYKEPRDCLDVKRLNPKEYYDIAISTFSIHPTDSPMIDYHVGYFANDNQHSDFYNHYMNLSAAGGYGPAIEELKRAREWKETVREANEMHRNRKIQQELFQRFEEEQKRKLPEWEERYLKVLKFSPPPPPWIKFPEYARYDRGWRTGSGKDYIENKINPYFHFASELEIEVYKSKYPTPKDWEGWYKK